MVKRHYRKRTPCRAATVRHKPARSGTEENVSIDNSRLWSSSTVWTRQVSRDVPTDDGFVYDTPTVLRGTMKGIASRTNTLLSRQDMQCTYNTEVRSRNHCCRVKAISITYSESVRSLSYPARKAYAPYYIVICGLYGFTIFSHIIPQMAQFWGEKNYWTWNVLWFLYQFCLKHSSV
jgi:hypothetical protein